MNLTRSLVASVVFVAFVAIGALGPVEMAIQSMLVSLASLSSDINSKDPAETRERLVADSKIERLEQENSSLQKALDIQNTDRFKIINAYVIGRSNSPIARKLSISRGANSGIETGQVVLAEGVVIGKIDKVEARRSIIILNEDQAFRLEVEFDGNRGVLKGLINGAVIDRVLPNAKITKNTLVVSVAQANKIPAGLPVGRVVSTLKAAENTFQQVQIAGYEDAWRAHVIQVIVDE